MNKLLLDSQPLFIIPELATAIGLNEAIILQQIHYWLVNNEKADKNFEDGHYWTYGSYGLWKIQFPFWSEKTIKRIILKLEKTGLLISGNFNKMALDKTKWYRINYQKLEEITKQNASTIVPNKPTMRTICPDHEDNLSRPIPETSTDINNKTYVSEFEEFWKNYPRKSDKKQAYFQWKARIKSGVSSGSLLLAAKNYAAECIHLKREEKYIKHAKTFLSINGSYEEYFEKKGDSEELDFKEYGVDNIGWLPEVKKLTPEEEKAEEEAFMERIKEKAKRAGL